MTDAELAKRIRFALVQMHHQAQTGHLGGALSCVDILVALYNHPRPPFRLIFSKGHAISALYATLDCLAFKSGNVIDSFNQRGSKLPEQPSPDSYGVEWATGSLGHGLSVGVGFALADRLAKRDRHTYVLLSDGECQEGSVWEAAMLASSLKLTNLTAIVDANGWQATQRTMEPEKLMAKFSAFGWGVSEVVPRVNPDKLLNLVDANNTRHLPRAVLALTLKGAGISFMEDDLNWHYRHPSAEDVERARKELFPDPHRPVSPSMAAFGGEGLL